MAGGPFAHGDGCPVPVAGGYSKRAMSSGGSVRPSTSQ